MLQRWQRVTDGPGRPCLPPLLSGLTLSPPGPHSIAEAGSANPSPSPSGPSAYFSSGEGVPMASGDLHVGVPCSRGEWAPPCRPETSSWGLIPPDKDTESSLQCDVCALVKLRRARMDV